MIPTLELNKVNVRFGGVLAVKNISLSVLPGEIRGLIGPNGAGKTTLINAITGIVPIHSGQILVRGSRVDGASPHRTSRIGVGRTFQHVEAFDEMTVLQNVLVGAGRGERAGVLDYAFGLPNARTSEKRMLAVAMETIEAFQLNHVMNTPARELPFGLLKRMDLARAMVAAPILLFMDEPTSGMSESEADSAISATRTLAAARQTTLLVVEHNMRVMMSLAQRITVIQFGEVIAEGTPAAIQSDTRVIDAYLGEPDELGS